MLRLIFFLSICIYYTQAAPDPTQLLKREANPKPSPRLKLVKRETETEDSEEFTELEELVVMIYIAHLVEIGVLDADLLDRKVRSVVLKREAAPQPNPRLKLIKRETDTDDSEEFTEIEDLIVMIYIAHLVEIGVLDADLLDTKARSVVKREITENPEEVAEEILRFIMEIGLLDANDRKSRSLTKRENSEEHELSNEDWEELISLLVQSLMENGSFEDDFLFRKARSTLFQ